MSNSEDGKIRRRRAEPDGPLDDMAARKLDLPLLSIVVFVLAAGIRALSLRYVLRPDGVIFFDGDSYYHMWRIWRAASKSIPLSATDPFVNFPNGGEILWPPTFDWIFAKAITLFALDQHSAETLCAWAPVLFGAAAVVLAAQIAARTFSRMAGWITGLVLAVLPGSFNYTQIGFFDHHAAIALIGTALLGGAMRIVEADDHGPRAWPWLAGALSALALSTWTGALLQIGILQTAMLLWALGAEKRASAVGRTLRLALAHGITAIALLPISFRTWRHFGDFDPLAPTLFQPLYFGSGAFCLAAAAALWRMPQFGHTRVRRFISSSALGVVGIGIAFAAIPQLTVALTGSANWFSDDQQFLSVIIELEPLFGSGKELNWRQVIETLSLLFFGFPLAMAAIVWRTNRPDRWLLLWWAAAFLVLTLSQVRFVNTFSIAFSIVTGGAISLVYRYARIRTSQSWPRGGPVATAAAGIVLGAFVVAPAWSYYERALKPHNETPRTIRLDAYRSVARWLAATNPTRVDEQGNPEQGLLCPWPVSHEFRYYSGWATHVDGFGPYVSPENTRLAGSYFRSVDEDAAIDILEKLGTRYVVIDISHVSRRPKSKRIMRSRLGLKNGSGREVITDGGVRRTWIPALTRHRLVFDAPHTGDGVWLYEIVKGAEIVGSAAPGSTIEAELNLRSSSGRILRWINRETVDSSGNFRMRVPYATKLDAVAAVTPVGPYKLRTSRGEVRVHIGEAAIRDGAVITAPLIKS